MHKGHGGEALYEDGSKATPWEKVPGPHWIETWQGPTASLNMAVKSYSGLPGIKPKQFNL